MSYILAALVTALAFQLADAEQPAFKIKGHGKVAVDGGATMQEKPDVTLEAKIDDTVVQVTEAMRSVTDARGRGQITDQDWTHVKEILKGASSGIDQAKASFYRKDDADPLAAMLQLKAVEGLLAQAKFWTE